MVEKIKLGLDQDFRDTLNNNFEKLDAKTNINGQVFSSIDDRLRAIEYGMQESGLPIDGDSDQYTVYQNRTTFTQTESKAFISDVDDMVAKATARFEPIEQKLSAAQTASKILTDRIDSLNESIDKNRVDSLNESIDKNRVALKNVDNTFTGGNTFEKKIVAPNGLQGKSDSAGQADEATHAMKADSAKNADLASKLVPTNDQTVNNLTVNGDTVVNKLDVNGQLNVGGNQKVARFDDKRFGGQLSFEIYRIGNNCAIKFLGTAQGVNFSNIGPERIKLGFRPISDVVVEFNDGGGYCNFVLTPDGSIWRRKSSPDWGGEVFSSATYITNDSWPE